MARVLFILLIQTLAHDNRMLRSSWRETLNKAKMANVGIWTLSVLTAALFLLSAIPKLTMPGWVGRFAAWGYPEWFLYVIAGLEIVGAIGLLVPRFAAHSAGLLIVIMFGAMYTHLTHDEGIWWNLAYLVCLTLIGWYRIKNNKST